MGWKKMSRGPSGRIAGTMEAAGAFAAAGMIIDVFTMTGLGTGWWR